MVEYSNPKYSIQTKHNDKMNFRAHKTKHDQPNWNNSMGRHTHSWMMLLLLLLKKTCWTLTADVRNQIHSWVVAFKKQHVFSFFFHRNSARPYFTFASLLVYILFSKFVVFFLYLSLSLSCCSIERNHGIVNRQKLIILIIVTCILCVSI